MLPLVGSTMVPPGCSQPLRSARSIMGSPIRSFTEPPGFMYSTLATRLPGGWMRPSRTSGVLPIASTMFSWISMAEPTLSGPGSRSVEGRATVGGWTPRR